jgi:hypothetical protein
MSSLIATMRGSRVLIAAGAFNSGRPQESLLPEVACVRSALVPATTVEAMVPVTKPQHQVGTAIVWAIVVAVPMVAPTATDGSAAAKVAMPPATVRAPAAASMIAVCFADQTVFDDGTVT